MNPLYSLLGGGNPFQGTPFGNFMNFMNYANQLKQTLSGNGSYQQQVQNMLNSGQLSQDRYNAYIQQAQAIQKFLGGNNK